MGRRELDHFRDNVRNREFPGLRARLEGERNFGIVGLFGLDGPLTGHQVLAYGFTGSPAAGASECSCTTATIQTKRS